MDKCFADVGKAMCFALIEKDCEFCNFFKPREQALEELRQSPHFHEDRSLKALEKAWEE